MSNTSWVGGVRQVFDRCLTGVSQRFQQPGFHVYPVSHTHINAHPVFLLYLVSIPTGSYLGWAVQVPGGRRGLPVERLSERQLRPEMTTVQYSTNIRIVKIESSET